MNRPVVPFQCLPQTTKLIGLYIHFPWCVRKCPYCDFNSHTAPSASTSESQYKAYLQALLLDLAAEYELWAGLNPMIQSVFIGGGTPSLAPGWFYQTLLDAVKSYFRVVPKLEVTLEANPGAAEYDHFEFYLAAGINRVSLGVQSFSPSHLTALGRIHSVEQVYEAFNAARTAGFQRINLDLMFGLPKQSIEQGMRDLTTGLALEPEHLSWYQLTVEPNTAFYSQPPSLDLETSQVLWDAGRQLLHDHGYTQYEVSAYAKPNERCRHNEHYWRFGDYAAIGAGAHGKISLAVDEVWRYQKTRLPAHYLARAQRIPVNARLNLPSGQPFTGQSHCLSPADLQVEFALNRLRLFEPVSRQEYEQTGASWLTLQPWLETQAAKGLLNFDQQQFELTAMGYSFLDDLLSAF